MFYFGLLQENTFYRPKCMGFNHAFLNSPVKYAYNVYGRFFDINSINLR